MSLSLFSQDPLLKYFSISEIKKANTASGISYFSETEKETLEILNLARLYPGRFLILFNDYAGSSELIKTNTYYSSLASDLKKMKPIEALRPDLEMYNLAKCWATEAGKTGVVGHDRKKCSEGYFAECCTYGRETALEIIMSLLIDEGVKSLGHRRICLSARYTAVGISTQAHSDYGTNTVMDFTFDDGYAQK